MFYFLGFIAICIFVVVIDAYLHRQRARLSGDPIGSIWYHMEQSKREEKEKKAKKKAEKKDAAILKKNESLSISALKKVREQDAKQSALPDAMSAESLTAVLAQHSSSINDVIRQKRLSGKNKNSNSPINLEISKPEQKASSSVIVKKGISFSGFDEGKLSELVALAEASGWTWYPKISNKIGVLVVGAQPGSKLIDAKAIGIPIISEQDFKEMCISDEANHIDLPDRITFLYENAEGETAYRDVTVYAVDSNVRGHDYIAGYCNTAGAKRTFRIDRMIGMITQALTGEMLMPDDWLGRVGHMKTTKPSVARPPVPSTSVLFTGFKKLDRDRLESQATALGWHVRKTVSETLDYMVTGDNAGPVKIRDAEMFGVDIIDEDDFLDLMVDEMVVI